MNGGFGQRLGFNHLNNQVNFNQMIEVFFNFIELFVRVQTQGITYTDVLPRYVDIHIFIPWLVY